VDAESMAALRKATFRVIMVKLQFDQGGIALGCGAVGKGVSDGAHVDKCSAIINRRFAVQNHCFSKV